MSGHPHARTLKPQIGAIGKSVQTQFKILTANRHLTKIESNSAKQGSPGRRRPDKQERNLRNNCNKLEFMSLPGPSWTIAVPEKLACDVYIGCMPLRVPALAPKALPSVLSHLGVQHFYTLIQQPSEDACMYYDFLPANPEDPLVVAALLSGQRVEGIVQEKKLQRPPRQRCWWVGKTETRNGFESARDFNTQWDSRLSLFHHDCRHYTNGLVHHLTGKKDMISRLGVPWSRKGLDMDPAPVTAYEDSDSHPFQ